MLQLDMSINTDLIHCMLLLFEFLFKEKVNDSVSTSVSNLPKFASGVEKAFSGSESKGLVCSLSKSLSPS